MEPAKERHDAHDGGGSHYEGFRNTAGEGGKSQGMVRMKGKKMQGLHSSTCVERHLHRVVGKTQCAVPRGGRVHGGHAVMRNKGKKEITY